MMTQLRHRFLSCLPLLSLPVLVAAAPLTQPTAVHLKPDANAPVLSVLQPGTEAPELAPGGGAPTGWVAVLVPGPHDVYVENKDIMKSLEVKPGAAYRARPQSDSAILALAAPNDPVEITGLRGRWTELRLSKTITGYLPAGSLAAAPAPNSAVTTTPVRDQAVARPETARATPAPGPGQAVRRAPDDTGAAALPRLFEGRFVSTRTPLRPRRPYDFALEDESGSRIAYVDLSKLLLTDQIENYLGRTVAAYGTVEPLPSSKDIVVRVESLQLR